MAMGRLSEPSVPDAENSLTVKLFFNIIAELLHRGKYSEQLFLAGMSGDLDIHARVIFMVAHPRLNQVDAMIFNRYDVIENLRI